MVWYGPGVQKCAFFCFIHQLTPIFGGLRRGDILRGLERFFLKKILKKERERAVMMSRTEPAQAVMGILRHVVWVS